MPSVTLTLYINGRGRLVPGVVLGRGPAEPGLRQRVNGNCFGLLPGVYAQGQRSADDSYKLEA